MNVQPRIIMGSGIGCRAPAKNHYGFMDNFVIALVDLVEWDMYDFTHGSFFMGIGIYWDKAYVL